MASKRKALFGGGLTPQHQQSVETPSEQDRQQITNKRPVTGPPLKQDNILADGNASIGSAGSGIEVLDLPNSRQKRMLRPPTGGTIPSGSKEEKTSSSLNNNSLRPPSGPGNVGNLN